MIAAGQMDASGTPVIRVGVSESHDQAAATELQVEAHGSEPQKPPPGKTVSLHHTLAERSSELVSVLPEEDSEESNLQGAKALTRMLDVTIAEDATAALATVRSDEGPGELPWWQAAARRVASHPDFELAVVSLVALNCVSLAMFTPLKGADHPFNRITSRAGALCFCVCLYASTPCLPPAERSGDNQSTLQMRS